MKRNLLLAAAAILGLTVATSANADVILTSDTFSRTLGSGDGNGNPAGAGNGSSDLGSTDLGLGGTIVAPYVTTPSRSGGANQVTGTPPSNAGAGSVASLLNGGAILDLGSAIEDSSEGFSVGFTFDRNTDPATPATNGGFLAFGLAPADTTPSAIGGAYAVAQTTFGLLFQQANNGNAANATVLEDNANGVNFDYGDPSAPADVLVTFTPATIGDYEGTVNFDVAVNGSSLQTGSFDATGDNLNVLAFSSNNFDQRYFDNLVVTRLQANAIPEPTSLAALAALGLAGVVRRRRR